MKRRRTVRKLSGLLVGLSLLACSLWADDKTSPSTKELKNDQEITNSIGMTLVLIRAGNFMMGSPDSDKDAGDNEKPQHRVRIKNPFYLGKYEVTRGEFRKFVTATKYKTDTEKKGLVGVGFTGKKGDEFAQKPELTWRNASFEQTDEHPVVNVSWNDAVAFCEWLSKKEGKTYRLPTEAEWEWSCRAGTIDRWSSGDKAEDLKGSANIADASLKAVYADADWAKSWNDGFPFTSPVGKFRANKFGLHDLHGNVWEWCADWYDEKYYTSSPTNDPPGAKSGTSRVLRGGSWFGFGGNSRSAVLNDYAPDDRNDNIGFRVACAAPARTR